MASLFRSYYRKKVNDLYDYVNSHKEDAIKIKGLLEYHQDMLSGMDQVVIKVSGELDAIFLFYVKDRRDALEKLKDSTLSPEQFGKGFKFPYRLEPRGLAVVRTIGDYYSKIPEFGGKSGTNIPYPCVNLIPIDDESDFILLGCKKIF